MIAPVRDVEPRPTRAWEGYNQRKPWHYSCTAVIPHLDTPELLETCVGLLRLTNTRPYILVIDTGSRPQNVKRIEELRGVDLEIHYVRSHAWVHPSDPVAVAMDLAQSLCCTRFMYCTHADCFLKRRELLDDMISLSIEQDNPCVGYQLTERAHEDWEWMVGHTCTMLDVEFMDKHRISWSQRGLCRRNDVKWSPNVVLAKKAGEIKNPAEQPNWPDTELAMNYGFRDAEVTPLLIGSEENYQRNNNDDFDHVRSLPSLRLHADKKSPNLRRAEGWMESALAEAQERIREWTDDDAKQQRADKPE